MSEWDQHATLRAQQIESGIDLTFTRVFEPFYSNLVGGLKPASILEVGSGTGHLARRLHPLTSRYVAIEPSQGMFTVSRATLQGTSVHLENCTIQEMQRRETFDLVLCHLCIHAVKDLVGFLSAFRCHVAANGVFLVSLPHPAFFQEYKHMFSSAEYSYMSSFGGMTSFSITKDPDTRIAEVPYYHRPISKYLATLASVGLTNNYFYEIFPSEEVQSLYGRPWTTPRYLVLGGSLSGESVRDTTRFSLQELERSLAESVQGRE